MALQRLGWAGADAREAAAALPPRGFTAFINSFRTRSRARWRRTRTVPERSPVISATSSSENPSMSRSTRTMRYGGISFELRFAPVPPRSGPRTIPGYCRIGP